MAVVTSAVVGIGASLYGAKRASDATKDATNDAIAEQRRAEDTARGDLEPYRTGGQVGLDNVTAAAGGDASNFFASPGYEFVRSEGLRDVGNVFSARGGGGNAMRALAEYGAGLASTEYGNWFNRNLNLATVGANAAAGQATATQQSANNIGNTAISAGNQLGQIYDARASGVGNAIQGGISNWLYRSGTRSGPETLEEIPMYSLPRRR